jgi:hypothetical protein
MKKNFVVRFFVAHGKGEKHLSLLVTNGHSGRLMDGEKK